MTYRSILADCAHRPYPLAVRPHVGYFSWRDLLFAHWPVASAEVQAQLPAALTLDTFAGAAWLSVVPFRMANLRPRFAPAVPGLSWFPELNLRTYVRMGDRLGIYFFSLDASSRLGVALARRFFHLPYFRARMAVRQEASGAHRFDSHRTHPAAPPAVFSATYRSLGTPVDAPPGSLAAWLTERYFFASVDGQGRPIACQVHHRRWPLQAATAQFRTNTLAQAAGLSPLPAVPALLHFVPRIDVVGWLPAPEILPPV